MMIEPKPSPKALTDEIRRRQQEAEDEQLKGAIRDDLTHRLIGYEFYTAATVMPDRRTGRLHICLQFSVTYERASELLQRIRPEESRMVAGTDSPGCRSAGDCR